MDYGWIFEKCLEIKDDLVRWRRTLHTLAEVGFKTEKTKEFIACELRKMGLCPKFLGGGIVCEIRGTLRAEADIGFHSFNNIDEKDNGKVTRGGQSFQKIHKCVLLRADVDALPIEEKTALEYKAKNGNMHACGHDMHVASLLGAARVLSQNKDEFCGTVKLVFQSAEEILSGAKRMIEAGVLESPDVDFCVALHVVVGTELETGTVILPSGGMSAPYADNFKIRVRGQGGHGAEPHKSKNAALVGAAITDALGKLGTAGEDFTLSVCQINSGNAPNVIPEECEIGGTIRALSKETEAEAIKKSESICRTTAASFGCSSNFEVISTSSALFCDENLAKSAEECLKSAYKSLPSKCNATVIKTPKSALKASTPSEDFAEFAMRKPSLLIGLCAGKKNKGYSFPLHNPRTVFDENALPFGSLVYTTLAIWLSNAPRRDNQPQYTPSKATDAPHQTHAPND